MATPNWDIPDFSQIYYIKANVGRKWKDLARMLGFSEADIEEFEDNHPNKMSERCMEMLKTWRQREGNGGTVDALKAALEQAELKNIADELDDHKDKYPTGMNYRTRGDNQEVNEQDKRGMTEIRVGNQTASDEANARIQRAVEILMGPNFSGPSTEWQKGMHRFHPTVHGTQVCIENNATVARSHDSFNNSLCFSEMPIQVGEKVYLKVIDSRIFDEALRFGFTSEDPKSMKVEELSQLSYPNLALQSGFWVKPLPASQALQGCVVTFTLEESGNVTFAVNGEDKGLFFSGVNTSTPLWAVVDVHGSTVAVQFVGEQEAANVFDKQIHEGDQVQLVKDTETLRDMQNRHGGFTPDMRNLAKGEVGIALGIYPVYVDVFFPSINKRWFITPAALQKVKRPDIKAIIGGDLVKIKVGRKKLQSIQKKHHLWKKEMEQIKVGEIGRVVDVLRDGQLAVRMAGKDTNIWAFHHKVVEKIAKQGDMCAQGLHHWRRGVSRTCVHCGECTAEGFQCSMKGKPLRSNGSCCGCSREVLGCADCGFCWFCAGEHTLPSRLNELNSFIFSEGVTSSEIHAENELFKKGDLVRVLEDEEELKKLQIAHGGYTNECIGKIGFVKKVEGGQVQVVFLFSRPWIFNPGAVTKVSSVEEQKPIHQLKAGDCVKVAVSAKTFNVNQVGHGGPMTKVLQDMVMEKAGIVRYVDIDGDAFVIFQNGIRHLINPASLDKVNPVDYNSEDSSELKVGEWVKVDDDKARIKQVQTGTVDGVPWDDGFYAAVGKIGQVGAIDPTKKTVVVSLDYGDFPLNCTLVKRASLEDVQGFVYQSLQGSDFARGDLVKINVSLEELKGLQEGHGGFAPNMARVLEKDETGSVCFIDSEGDVYVKFNTGKCMLSLNPTVLTKVTTEEDMFHVGDLVRIDADVERLKSLQKPFEHGGYQEEMVKLCGKTGRILFILDDKKFQVKVEGRGWFFNPDVLRRLGGPTTDTASWKSATICAPGKHCWSSGRCLVCVDCGGCTHHGKLCPASGSANRTPGSVSGCGNGHAGCDDCGACMACGEHNEDDLLKEIGKLQHVVMETIQKTLTEEVGKRLAFHVDDAKTVVVKHRQSEYGEVEVEKNLALLENVRKTLQLMREGDRAGHSILEGMHVMSQLIDVLLFESNPAIMKSLGVLFSSVSGIQPLIEYARYQSSQANQSDGNDGKLKNLYCLVEKCTDASLQFGHAVGHAVGRSGLMLMTVQELARRLEMEVSDGRQEWMHILVSILGSCARVPENLEYFRDARAVDLLKKLKKESDMPLRVSSLRCLAHIADAEDTDLTQLEADDIDFFMNILNTAVSNDTHEAPVGTQTWKAIDLVKDLHAFASHEGVNQTFLSKGAMKPLIQLIEGGNDMEKEYAMLCVQRFAMVDSIRETIVSGTRIEAVLRALLTQQDQIYAVLVTARNTLKCLGKEPGGS